MIEAEHERQRVAETNVQLGLGYLKQGRVQGALEKLQKALDAEPDYAEAHSSIALVYEELQENDRAAKHFERALELNPDDGATHNNYAVFLCHIGKAKEAEPHFLAAIKSRGYPTPERAYENLGICAMETDRAKAETYLRKALQMNPRLPGALLQMAQLSVDHGNYLSGRAYLQRYHEVQPPVPQSLWLGIKVEQQLGDEAAARDYALQLRRKFPDSDETRKLLEAEPETP
jgi:type IV pilus assembly protein PilF